MARKQYEQKDNSGVLFKNDKKESEKHPDRKGSALIDGVEYWVSGWLKKSKDGDQYMSLAFTPKDEKQGGRKSRDEEAPFEEF